MSGKYLGQLENFAPTEYSEDQLTDGMILITISSGDFNTLKKYGESDVEAGSFPQRQMVKELSAVIKIDQEAFADFSTINSSAAQEFGFPVFAIQSYDDSSHIYKVDQGSKFATEAKGHGSIERTKQVPVGNLNNLGVTEGQFNIILDTFFTRNQFKRH